LGQLQRIAAAWPSPRQWRVDITPKDDLLTVFRSFSGEGSTIEILWDGMDSSDNELPPQMIGYQFYDLGPGSDPAPLPGGGGGSPPGFNAIMTTGIPQEVIAYPSSALEAMQAGLTSYFIPPPPMPPIETNGTLVPWESVYGPLPMMEVQIPESTLQQYLAKISQRNAGISVVGGQSSALFSSSSPVFSIFWPYKRLGTIGILSQGHHPKWRLWSKFYPTPIRGGTNFGFVRMSSDLPFGPWGPLAAPSLIAVDCEIAFPAIGYECIVRKSDNYCTAADLRAASSGGSNTLNQVNLGLFVGHSVAGRDAETSLGYAQSYVPIYNSVSDTMTYVKCSEMNFGSSDLKWMAFYSCNLFRDSIYRTNGVYDQMKTNSALPMNNQLHILQGYATEMSVHPNMVSFWTLALRHKTGSPEDYTVLGAWKYVCRKTQPTESYSKANVSRSIYWPACAEDYIYGWGPQSDPGNGSQSDLQEDDQRAPYN
jgi:hypothetical protein